MLTVAQFQLQKLARHFTPGFHLTQWPAQTSHAQNKQLNFKKSVFKLLSVLLIEDTRFHKVLLQGKIAPAVANIKQICLLVVWKKSFINHENRLSAFIPLWKTLIKGRGHYWLKIVIQILIIFPDFLMHIHSNVLSILFFDII